MLTYKIHMIRHGLTSANLEGRYIGLTDLPLCQQGKEQLRRLIKTCEYPPVDRVYVSPLARARETAEMLYPDRLVEEVQNLRELNFGAFEGRTITDLEQDEQFQHWIAAPASTRTPDGESGAELQMRAIEALAYIFAQMMEKRIPSAAVITHGGLIVNLLAAMGLPEREAVRWQVEGGHGYTILLTPQMWMRDRKFEVYAQIPYSPEQELAGPVFTDLADDWEDEGVTE